MRLHAADDLDPYFVAIGASGSGGLHDLCLLLECFPSSLPAVVLAVLHRPSNRISHLRQVLARRSALPVVIPEEDQEFRTGTCYIGEPAAHLSLAERSRVCLVEGANNRYRNRTVDLLLTSVAAHARTRAIGVVLRGSLSMAHEGLPPSISPAASPWLWGSGEWRPRACRPMPLPMMVRSTSSARSRRLL